MSRYRIVPICVLLACIGSSFAPSMESGSVSMAGARDAATGPGRVIAGIVGTWESTHFGHQSLTTRPDGTATITMSLTPMAAVLYGRHVTLNLQWSLDGEMLTQHIIGGSPARSVEKLVAKFGGTHTYRVLEQQRDHLLVAEADSESQPVCWTAVTVVN